MLTMRNSEFVSMRIKICLSLVLLMLVAGLFMAGGCISEQDSSGNDSSDNANIPLISQNAEELTLRAKNDLAQKLNLVAEEIKVCSVTESEQDDIIAGAPQEHLDNAQTTAPDFTILLEVNGEIYEYRTNQQQVELRTDIVKTTPPPFR